MSRVVERQGTNTRAHIDMRALRVFLNNDEKKYKIERVKISQYPGCVCVCVCKENPIFLFLFHFKSLIFFLYHITCHTKHHVTVFSKLSKDKFLSCLARFFLKKLIEYSWNFLLITILRRSIR